MSAKWVSASVTVRFDDGKEITVNLVDDDDRPLSGEISTDTESIELPLDGPFREFTPGRTFASIRLFGRVDR
jgi:hypothetical protein